MIPQETKEGLAELCKSRGAVGFGVCRLNDIKTDDFLLPEKTTRDLPNAISIALHLSPAVLGTLEDHPNQLYEHHYRQVNFALDRLGLDLAALIESLGALALPVAASQLVDWQNQRGHLSHKRVAVGAGLGWLGRNNLLVTPRFGSQVRLVTILTDLDLEPDHPLENGCGSCRACITACPAKAIGETQTEFKHLDCFAMLKEFQSKRYVSQYICGLCVRACGGTRDA
ncbi:epoxyqueuosine reductase [candidate division WOR-3 bacterium]|uniref:Epoxyqueuosine reductase n=1 Tax=candidate division WOR-3 bacterium TaxID=2052148 RepID=A0A938BS98_UNCW3|nr:epoxyqueuosine reductase [candidate division WOR-3 bacterium]